MVVWRNWFYAIDLRSIFRKEVWVRLPLPLPIQIKKEILQMISLDNCPICSADWTISIFTKNVYLCDKCKIMYYSYHNILTISDVFGKRDHELHWYFKSNHCRYFEYIGDNLMRKMTILPLLPLNITYERLKLYVNFA